MCVLLSDESAGVATSFCQRMMLLPEMLFLLPEILFSTLPYSGNFFFFFCICQTRLQTKNASNTTPRQSTLCQCENTHKLCVKIVLLCSKNANHTSQHRGHFCLRGLFPQQAEQFMSEFNMSTWTGCGQRSSNCPPAWPAAHGGRMWWPSSPFPPDLLHPKSAAPGQVAGSQPSSSQICPWYGWHPVRRCRSGGR